MSNLAVVHFLEAKATMFQELGWVRAASGPFSELSV